MKKNRSRKNDMKTLGVWESIVSRRHLAHSVLSSLFHHFRAGTEPKTSAEQTAEYASSR